MASLRRPFPPGLYAQHAQDDCFNAVSVHDRSTKINDRRNRLSVYIAYHINPDMCFYSFDLYEFVTKTNLSNYTSFHELGVRCSTLQHNALRT